MEGVSVISLVVSGLSLLVSGGSLYVAYRAFQRSGSDRRLRLRRGARELGMLLDGAIATLARARQSRPAVLSMEGLARSGAAQVFEQEAATVHAELTQLRERARAEFGEIAPGIADTEIETKLVDLAGVKARVEQIRDKYLAALAEDDQKRAEKRRAMHALGNQIRRDRSRGNRDD
jgi:hypothetical protein